MKSLITYIFIVVSAWYGVSSTDDSRCDYQSGPPGRFGCVSLPEHGYTGRKQFANCLSNAYIRQKSGGRHVCVNSRATFCWYQCMLEVHNIESGRVTDDCACEDNEILPTVDLPQDCYSPDGSNCAWYRECLERRHQCAGSGSDYAIQYAEHFCGLYVQSSGSFSSQGRAWIDAVRKCLQVALVPAIRPYYKGNCNEIKKTAFASHAACYLRPDAASPGICDLNPRDWWRVFWTVKGAIISKDWYRALWEMASVGGACAGQLALDALTKVDSVVSQVLVLGEAPRLRLSARQVNETDQGLELDRKWEVVEKAAKGAAEYLHWNRDERFDWFAFTTEDEGSTAANFSVHFWFRSSNASNTENVQDEAQKFESWIASGKDQLSFEVAGTRFKAMGISTCNDSMCANVTKFVEFASSSSSASLITAAYYAAIPLIAGQILVAIAAFFR
ncbi:uncharacterized protein LOC129601741 [Paramacrobiotus metropolitanus]|uniref:uncharacterized protein LOC129601741 n=1 Tax=Paramacrobiotus metropolitanus TaxID=2943436 RepID=UPI002445EEAB|nr:uncharacterized protein LOC129601741 [Paramacrobiotus metropolitanus]